MRLVLSIPLSALAVNKVEALGLSEMVDGSTSKASEELFPDSVVGGVTVLCLVVLVRYTTQNG